MKILAIETATDACSAALLIDNDCMVEFETTPRQHTKLILPMIDKLLAEANITLNDMDAIAFGRGPGAFTGLRIAAGVTQGLALAADLPVIPVSTLAALAQQAYEKQQQQQIMVALDARINEVYWGCYIAQDGRVSLHTEEQVVLPQAITFDSTFMELTSNDWTAIGSGWSVYSDILQDKVTTAGMTLQHIDTESMPSAAFIARLAVDEYKAGRYVAAEEAQPVYLRDKVADTIVERRKKQYAQ